MVRVHFGKREAFLRVVDGKVAVCDPTGLQWRFTQNHLTAQDALSWLADHWKLETMFCCESDDMDSWIPVYGDERIISEQPVAGELTHQQEFDWLMFNVGSIVYNTVDDRLWQVGLSEYPKKIPPHRKVYAEEWSIPQHPDRYYDAFERSVKAVFPSVAVSTRNQLGHYKVAQRVRETRLHDFPSVEIRMDESVGYHRVIRLHGKCMKVEYFSLNEDKTALERRAQSIRSLCEEQLLASWKSFFPSDWDVVEVSKTAFYEHTFAGHCYQTENFVGLKSVPPGFAIAWENRFDDMILLRVRSDGTVCCPTELKGRVIGTKGGNIKRVAHLLGKEHWQVKVV